MNAVRIFRHVDAGNLPAGYALAMGALIDANDEDQDFHSLVLPGSKMGYADHLVAWVFGGQVEMETQLTPHEQHILASDRALIEAARLVCSRVPLQAWPTHLRVAVSMALAHGCDETRLAKNRVSAHRANDLYRFLSRRGSVHSVPCAADLAGEPTLENVDYVVDRLLADLVTKVCAMEHSQRVNRERD